MGEPSNTIEHEQTAQPEPWADDPTGGTLISPLQALVERANASRAQLHGDEPLCRERLTQIADELAEIAHYFAELNRERSEFLGKVSHELRTPLTIARGWISSLRYGELLPEQERVVQVIDQQIDQLTRLVNDLLDLSRREVDGLALNPETVDLCTLIEQIAEHQRELPALRQISLETRSELPEALVSVDRGRIAQVLNNMITNACRYVPQDGSGRIVLAVDRHAAMLRISVADNGSGIAPEHLPRIFEPFYQVRKGQRGKTGLGLAIAREIVHSHGGVITVESAPGAGATFRIWLRPAGGPLPGGREKRRSDGRPAQE